MAAKNTHHADRLTELVQQLEASYEPEEAPSRDPVTQLVVAFLQWEHTREAAEQALGRLMAELVDINELRVSLDSELIALIGEDYPLAAERVARMREALDEIYLREYAVEMRSIADRPKKEQRAYLETLAGAPPYVAASVMLLSFGGHAMPADRKLVELLAEEEVLDERTQPPQAESFLQRHVKAEHAVQTHLLLQAWADEHETPDRAPTPAVLPAPEDKPPARQAPSRGGAGKKTTKKKAADKTTKKTTRRSRKK